MTKGVSQIRLQSTGHASVTCVIYAKLQSCLFASNYFRLLSESSGALSHHVIALSGSGADLEKGLMYKKYLCGGVCLYAGEMHGRTCIYETQAFVRKSSRMKINQAKYGFIFFLFTEMS